MAGRERAPRGRLSPGLRETQANQTAGPERRVPTEVRAPQNGVVQEVFVEATQGVEYGQTLLSLVAEG